MSSRCSKFIIIIFLFLLQISFAKLPEINAHDVRKKVAEILSVHVKHKKFSNELMIKTLHNYIEELDPMKTYFCLSDIQKWLDPKPEEIEQMLNDFEKGDYTTFRKIHKIMGKAISRRNKFEQLLEKESAIEHTKEKDFSKTWAGSPKELYERLLSIRSLQQQAAEKMDEENSDNFFQRIKKYRLHKESELLGTQKEEQNKLIFTHFLKAFCSALDSQSYYFTPIEANQFIMQVEQRLFGIGALLRDSLNGFTIVRILEKGPASKAENLHINDKIIAVNHEPVIGMDISEAVELIRGKKGSKILLTIIREHKDQPSEKIDVELTREEVVLEETRLETNLEPYADGVIAHLRLFSFYQDPKTSSSEDIKKMLLKIQQEHTLKGVVLDLRNNSGGLLPQAVSVTGLFISKGVVVSIKDGSNHIQRLRDTDPKVSWDGPLVILVNRASASAAEIVAQTLKDYGRAIVLGDDHTFGKGTFQTFTLDTAHDGKVNPKGEYKVTRGKYYTVSGKSPQLEGVSSDIEIPGLLSQLDIGEKFAKYPLENDQIEESFEDDLSDIPLLHRNEVSRLYKHNLQNKLAIYTHYLPILKNNSKERLLQNKSYQKFLKELENKNFDDQSIATFGQNDLQLQETFNVIKDLIFLLKIKQKAM